MKSLTVIENGKMASYWFDGVSMFKSLIGGANKEAVAKSSARYHEEAMAEIKKISPDAEFYTANSKW